MNLPPGLVDIPFSQYLADPGIGSHTMQEASRSRAHFERAKAGNDEDTPAMRFGRALHCMVLTPDLFWHDFELVDASSRATKIAKEAAARYPEKEILLDSEYCEVVRLSGFVHRDPVAAPLIAKANLRELSFFWERDGIRCKGRLDAGEELPSGELTVIDLKSCVSAVSDRAAGGESPFQNACLNYGYHTQAAYYSTGIKRATNMRVAYYILIAVEKKSAHVETYILSQDWLELGNAQYERNWRVITEEPKPKQIRSLPIPSWATRVE